MSILPKCMHVYITCMPGVLRSQKRVSGPLELKLQVIVSHLICVLGTKRSAVVKDQQELLTAKPPLQLLNVIFKCMTKIMQKIAGNRNVIKCSVFPHYYVRGIRMYIRW